jgi:Ca2+-binding RTX toxin-like protein
VLNLSGNVSISGTTPCDDDPERFSVFCGGGHAKFDYYVNDTFVATVDTGTACGAVARFSVDGRYGDDLIDLSRVSAADGFTGIDLPNIITGGAGADLLVGAQLANSVSGGSGNDIVMVRNGVPDTADCGTEIDAVQTDQSGVDSLTSCELVDPLPTAATPAAPAPTTPKKKCKKKHGHKKCKKRRATRR